MFCLFPECYRIGTIHYVSFTYWILSLSYIYCDQCPNPRAGREKASKTMQLAKRGSLLLTRARALCRIQRSGAGQRALSTSCYTNL